MLLSEYNKMMEEKGTPKVWVVETASFSGLTHSTVFLTEEEARAMYDSIPANSFRRIFRTWDIWGYTKRLMAKRMAQATRQPVQ